jgi:hypothetical protein
MNLIKIFKINKTKIIQLSIVVTTLFLITIFLYRQFVDGNYVFASGDYFAPKMISESIYNYQEIYGDYPYWLPSIFGGMPTIHSLQNISNYYMPNFILNILKIFETPEIWTQLIHLIFAGLGMYVLLRFLKIDFLISLFGSIMFLMTPYMNVCIVHGHGSQIMTASYIPWICWALFILWNKINLKNLGILAILIGFQLQRGHIQIAYYTWIMIAIFIILKIITAKFSLKFYYYLLGSLLSGFLMSLSIILPSYKYSEHSIRGIANSGAMLDYATNWSFSISEIITFLIPSFYGFGGQSYWGTIEPAMTDFPNYLGIFCIMFVIYGLMKRLKDSTFIYFTLVGLFFLLISLGKNFFLFEILFNYLPFFNKFRVPMMSLMIFQFSIIILSAYGLQSLSYTFNKKNNLSYLFVVSISLLITFIIFKFFILNLIPIKEDVIIIVKEMINQDLNRLISITFIILCISSYLLYNTINNKLIILSIVLLSFIDMYSINYKIINNPSIKIDKSSINNLILPLDNLKLITQDYEKPFRYISFTGYNKIRNWGAYANLEDITGYHPAKLKNYAKFEPYLRTNIGRNLFRLLNVSKIINWNQDWEIISTEEVLEPMKRIFFIDKLINYDKDEELLMAMNSDQFEPSKLSYTNSIIPNFNKSNLNSKVQIINWSPNQIIIETDLENSNFIGLSEIYYPNWEIVNHNIEIIQINGLIRGFVAPKGKNTIIMKFNYNDIKYSSLISIATFILMLIFILSTYLLTSQNKKD